MTYEELVDYYRSKNTFIYGKSVVQIVDMGTYMDSDGLKTDFVYHTERHHRGIITKVHGERVAQNLAAVPGKKEKLAQDILDAVTGMVNQFRKETGAAPKQITIHTSALESDRKKLVDYSIDSCVIDLDIHYPEIDQQASLQS